MPSMTVIPRAIFALGICCPPVYDALGETADPPLRVEMIEAVDSLVSERGMTVSEDEADNCLVKQL